MAKEQYYYNINYFELEKVKTILELLKVNYYYQYFFNTYIIEFTATPEQTKTI